MKQATALKYLGKVAERVRSVGGLLATPGCGYEAVRISRVWVFGSTVKGKKEPSDLDLLIEVKPVGRSRLPMKLARRMKCMQDPDRLFDGKTDRHYMRSYGIRACPDPIEYGLKWLTRNMRNVSRHTTANEALRPSELTLIYPRFDVDCDAIKMMEYTNDQ